jgi:hypothetical protein
VNDELTLEATIDVEAAPAEVWAVVSDLRRMGEWSRRAAHGRRGAVCAKGAWGCGGQPPGPMVRAHELEDHALRAD